MNELFASPTGMATMLVQLLSVLTGAALGMFFFGGLWWTTRRAAGSSHPALWFLASLLARMSVTLVGLYVVSGGRWERMLTCLLGFVAARMIVMRLTQPPLQSRAPMSPESEHAP